MFACSTARPLRGGEFGCGRFGTVQANSFLRHPVCTLAAVAAAMFKGRARADAQGATANPCAHHPLLLGSSPGCFLLGARPFLTLCSFRFQGAGTLWLGAAPGRPHVCHRIAVCSTDVHVSHPIHACPWPMPHLPIPAVRARLSPCWEYLLLVLGAPLPL